MLSLQLPVSFLPPGRFFPPQHMVGPTVLTYLLSCSAYPTHVIPPPSHPLPSSSIFFSLSPFGSRRGERWGRRRSPASDAAAAPGSERRGELCPQGERCGGGGPTAALGKRHGGEARRAGDGGGGEERRRRSKLVAGRRRRRCRRVVFFLFLII